MYNETISIFEKCSKELNLLQLHNCNDLVMYPNLQEKSKLYFSRNFRLDKDEVILYARDTSFWNDRDQGIVFTNKHIHIIFDNNDDDSYFNLPWTDIESVEYDSGAIYFCVNGVNPNDSSLSVNFLLKDASDDDILNYGQILAFIFNEIAECQEGVDFEEFFNDTIENIIKLRKEGNIDGALKIALEFNEKHTNCIILGIIASLYEEKGNVKKALQVLDEEILLTEDKDDDNRAYLCILNYSKALVLNNNNQLKDARQAYLYVMDNCEDDRYWIDDTNILKHSQEMFNQNESQLSQNFLSQPYNTRKLLIPVQEYTELSQKMVTVFDMENLPNIDFSLGHPMANQLYVGHPFLPKKYIPFENYELEFIEDKVREFCMIMQHLGATEITIESLNATSNSQDRTTHSDIKGGANVKITSVEASLTNDATSKFLDNISQSINLHQIFTPTDTPMLPDNLVWYYNEPSWHRIYAQRMKGGFLEHEERIETKKSQVIQNSELLQVAGEVKALFFSANIDWKQSMEEKFEAHDSATLSIRVKFAPLESLGKGATPPPLPQSDNSQVTKSLTDNENEYIETLKMCCSDNNISDGERRLLNRMRDTLGISEARAIQLEIMLTKPTLTETEQQYYDEYKASLDEDGSVSPIARRLLNKFRDLLGISESKANEIEKY